MQNITAGLKTGRSLCVCEYIISVLTFQGFLCRFWGMKIEKISDNQIKFTLNRADLASHQIKISELAYGTEKTKGLIQDMMEQASDELGFEFNDSPLMIEAIPVSMDCIVLMVTKVDEPEEVDTKFSGFADLKDLLSEDEEGEGEPSESSEETASDPVPEETPVPSFEAKESRRRTSKSASLGVTERMFSFASLEDVIDFAHQAGFGFRGESSLYSSPENKRYYLVLRDSAQDLRSFGRLCSTALEYGSKEPFGYAREAYMAEHFNCIIKKKALQSLAEL